MWIMSSGAASAPLMTEWDTVTHTYWDCVIRAARPTCHIGIWREGKRGEVRGRKNYTEEESESKWASPESDPPLVSRLSVSAAGVCAVSENECVLHWSMQLDQEVLWILNSHRHTYTHTHNTQEILRVKKIYKKVDMHWMLKILILLPYVSQVVDGIVLDCPVFSILFHHNFVAFSPCL